DPVDDHPGSQRIIGADQPLGKSQPVAWPLRCGFGKNTWNSWLNHFARRQPATPFKDVSRTRSTGWQFPDNGSCLGRYGGEFLQFGAKGRLIPVFSRLLFV